MSHCDTAKLEGVLKRLYLARKARRDATKAMRKYLMESWGESEPDEWGLGVRSPNAHSFGHCNLPMIDEDTPQLCSVCLGSKPLHEAYLKASREAGNALRQAQAIGCRLANDELDK